MLGAVRQDRRNSHVGCNAFPGGLFISIDQVVPRNKGVAEQLAFGFSLHPPTWRQNLPQQNAMLLVELWAVLLVNAAHCLEAIHFLAQSDKRGGSAADI